jgi:ABC-type transport system involved in multi-copper enzyme maturation permease subunit
MNAVVLRALARGVVLESIRRKDLWVVAILGFLILAASGALGIFGVQGLELFVKDLAASVLGIFSLIVAVMTSSRLLPDEIRNRTLYPLLARPISRLELVVGKYLGAVVVTWIGFLLLVAMVSLALAFFRVGFDVVMLQYVLAKLMGLAVVCAVGIGLSIVMTPNAAATMTFLLCAGSSMFSRAMGLAISEQPALGWLFRSLNAVIPQVHLFDLSGRAVYLNWAPVPLWVMLSLAAYAVAYAAMAVGFGWLRFRRQAL